MIYIITYFIGQFLSSLLWYFSKSDCSVAYYLKPCEKPDSPDPAFSHVVGKQQTEEPLHGSSLSTFMGGPEDTNAPTSGNAICSPSTTLAQGTWIF